MTPLSNGDWFGLPPAPARSREEALAVAKDVAQRAQQSPSRFSEFVREYSEDTLTRDHDGALGGVQAAEWALLFPEAVDALATLKPGEVSSVVETDSGFHVFLRRTVPKAQTLSARRIVIGHDRARFLRFAHNGREAARTREEALALAQSLVRSAREEPTRFADLVSTHTEHRDIKQGGDIGNWSTREPSPFARELEIIAALPVGGISEPIDSQFGFQVFIRDKARSRKRFAMAAIRLKFESGVAADHPSSQQSIRQYARSQLTRIGADSKGWSELQRQYGGGSVESWTLGRGPYNVTEVLETLKFDEFHHEPIESDQAYIIVKRLDPKQVAPSPEPQFELPDPISPKLKRWLRGADIPNLLELVAQVKSEAGEVLGLSKDDYSIFQRIHEELIAKIREVDIPECALEHIDDSWVRLANALDAKTMRRYLEWLNQSSKHGELSALADRGRRP